jgi:hypothetical protein
MIKGLRGKRYAANPSLSRNVLRNVIVIAHAIGANAAPHLPLPGRQMVRRKDTGTTPSRRAEGAGGG